MLAVVVGSLGTIYGAQGLGQSPSNAMNTIWNVPFKSWPNFFGRRLRGYFWLAVLGLATVGTTTLAGFGTTWLHGPLAWFWTTGVSSVVNLGVFFIVFKVLTSEPVGWRDIWLGVVLATLFWEALQTVGGYYVRNSLAHANATYGFFAIVIGLLSWLFVAAQLTLYAAEINVVRKTPLVAAVAHPTAADPSRPGNVRPAGHDGRTPARGEGERLVHDGRRRQPLDEGPEVDAADAADAPEPADPLGRSA